MTLNQIHRLLVTQEVGARDFLCNTLLTFGNRIRIGKLVEEMKTTQDINVLKKLVATWYRAISETPNGMYQADSLREKALKLVALEEVNGL